MRIVPLALLIGPLYNVAQQQKAHNSTIDLNRRDHFDQPRMAGVDDRLLLPRCLAASRLVTQVTAGLAIRHTADQAAISWQFRRIGKHFDSIRIKNGGAQPRKAVKILQEDQKLLFIENGSHGCAPFRNGASDTEAVF